MQTKTFAAGYPAHTQAGRVLAALDIFEMTDKVEDEGEPKPIIPRKRYTYGQTIVLENIAWTHLMVARSFAFQASYAQR